MAPAGATCYLPRMVLKEILEEVSTLRGSDYLANDPLAFPRGFACREDRELAAFFSAVLAYGRVVSIRNSLGELFRRMPEGPAAFVRGFEPRRDGKRFSGFRHRFNTGQDLACLCWLLREMIWGSGGLEGFFLEGDEPGAADIGPGLASFCRRALAMDFTPFFSSGELPADSGVRYFFPSPEKGSACKRLCMLLRWVCRPDDGVDLGLWKGISPARLVVPLDTHTARISRLLGLSGRKNPDWKMALEVTEGLRRFDPEDPVRFDFALAHLGISDGCSGRRGKRCPVCPVEGLCAKGPPGRGKR
jgi:uncharacterized protein (TIGR02757 family)